MTHTALVSTIKRKKEISLYKKTTKYRFYWRPSKPKAGRFLLFIEKKSNYKYNVDFFHDILV
jgi:hypothetical protein